MRISVDDMHRSTHKCRFILDSDIMLDGEPEENVILADEEGGFIERYVVTEGKMVLDETGECFKTEKVFGEVKIVAKRKDS